MEATAFYAVTLRPVQAPRGPAVASGSTTWLPGPARGTSANPVDSALLATVEQVAASAFTARATAGGA